MTEPKLTIEVLKNYLGTELKGLVIYPNSMEECTLSIKSGINNICDLTEFLNTTYKVTPICYRLSDLDNFIPELGFIPIDKIRDLNLGHCDWLTKEREELINKYGHEYWLGHIPYKIFKQLIEWHFWLFGEEYFTEGLVIDKILEHEQQN